MWQISLKTLVQIHISHPNATAVVWLLLAPSTNVVRLDFVADECLLGREPRFGGEPLAKSEFEMQSQTRHERSSCDFGCAKVFDADGRCLTTSLHER